MLNPRSAYEEGEEKHCSKGRWRNSCISEYIGRLEGRYVVVSNHTIQLKIENLASPAGGIWIYVRIPSIHTAIGIAR